MKCNRSFDQLGTDSARVESKCRKDGMLGHFQDLDQVIAQDLATLQRLGVTCQQVAYRMKRLVQAARKVYGGKLRVSERAEANRSVDRKGWCCYGGHSVDVDHFIVDIVTWGGAQECPFQSLEDKSYYGSQYGSQDLYVLNTKTDEILIFGSLLPHMIKRHSFFEGGGPYRVDPEAAVRILEIKPDQVRVPRNRVQMWSFKTFESYPRGAQLVLETRTHQFYIHPDQKDLLYGIVLEKPKDFLEPIIVAGHCIDLIYPSNTVYFLATIKE